MTNILAKILGVLILFINPWLVLRHKDWIIEVAAREADESREEVAKYFDKLLNRTIIIRAVILGTCGAVLLSNIIFTLRY